MEIFKNYVAPITGFAADLATIITLCAGVFIFFKNLNKFSAIYQVLIGLRNQESFKELSKKLDELDDLNADTKEQKPAVHNLLAEIHGQIRTNPSLAPVTVDLQNHFKKLIEGQSTLAEVSKRQWCAELREKLRGLNYEAIRSIVETQK